MLTFICVCCFTVGPCGHPWSAHCPWCEGQTRAWNLRKKSLYGCMLKSVRYIQFQCSFYFIFKIRRLWFTPGFLPTSRTNWLLLLVYHLCHSWICCFVLLCVMFSVMILFLNRGLLYHVCCSNVHNLLLSLFKAISRVTWLGRKKTALTAKWFHMAWMVI